jgi:hypothetical protein
MVSQVVSLHETAWRCKIQPSQQEISGIRVSHETLSFLGHVLLTVDAYETARLFPSGENKAHESTEESSVDDCGVLVKEATKEVEASKSKTENV